MMIILYLDLQPHFKYMNYFIYTSHHFTPHGRYELNKLTSLSVGRASHRYRKGHGFESRRSLDFFRLPLSNFLNWKIYCDDHPLLGFTTAVQIYELFHIYFTSTFTDVVTTAHCLRTLSYMFSFSGVKI